MCKPLLKCYTKTQLSKALGFSRHSFYTKSKIATKDNEVVSKIKKLYEDKDDTLGAKKIAPMLNIGKNRCQRIMNIYNLHPRRDVKGYKYPGKSDTVFENLVLKEGLSSETKCNTIKPLEIYFSDMFEFKLVDNTEIHGCFVLQKSTRQIVSILFDYFDKADLVRNTLQEADPHIIPESIFHVDQGTQHGAEITVEQVQDLKMKISMSRAGTPTDNPYAERFVRTFKLAVTKKQQYLTLNHFIQEAERWVKFYNEERPHESLNNLSPNQMAEKTGAKISSLNTLFRVY